MVISKSEKIFKWLLKSNSGLRKGKESFPWLPANLRVSS